MSVLLSLQVTSTYLSSDGRFVVGHSHKPVDLLRWDIVHADPYMDYKATDYSEDFKEEGIFHFNIYQNHVPNNV